MKVAMKTKKITLFFLFGMTLAVGLVMALRLSIGVIPAAAQAGTVSAKGSGQVAGTLECLSSQSVCSAGGQGAEFSFDFTGPAPTAPDQAAPVTGTLSVKFRATGDQVQFVTGVTGTAFIFPPDHILSLAGVCNFTTATGTLPAICTGFAQELAQPNSGNIFCLSGYGAPFAACGTVVSGGMQID
jgi:hypothetical protein